MLSQVEFLTNNNHASYEIFCEIVVCQTVMNFIQDFANSAFN